MDDLLTLLGQAQSTRNSIWTFYTIIITSAYGIAFTDAYRCLAIWIKVMISIAVGAAAWYNFMAMYYNALLINDIIFMIQNVAVGDIKHLFSDSVRFGGMSSMLSIHLVYVPVNIALFLALWWYEINALLRKNLIDCK